jgi:hypothetical protein
MGLDGEDCCKAKNACPSESILEKTPDSYDAETYDDPRGIAESKENLAVGKDNANQNEGDA